MGRLLSALGGDPNNPKCDGTVGKINYLYCWISLPGHNYEPFFNQTTQSVTTWFNAMWGILFILKTTLFMIPLTISMANIIYISAWSLNCKIWPPYYQVPYFQPIANSSGTRNASVAKGEVMTQRWTSWLCQNPEFYKIVLIIWFWLTEWHIIQPAWPTPTHLITILF